MRYCGSDFSQQWLSKIAGIKGKTKQKEEKQGGFGCEEKKKVLCNSLAAFLIEPPQHFSRGCLALRFDGLISKHVRMHSQRDGQRHTKEAPQTSFHLLFSSTHSIKSCTCKIGDGGRL